jgi:hypothetical protein
MSEEVRIDYEVTLDERVEAELRLLERASLEKEPVWMSGLVGLAVAGGTALWLSLRDGQRGIFIGCLAATGVGFLVMFFQRKQSRRKQLEAVIPMLGYGTAAYPSSVWIREGRLHSSGNHTEVIFELSDLREVKVDRSYVQLDFLSGGLFVVPESAFENASERDRFVVAVREG